MTLCLAGCFVYAQSSQKPDEVVGDVLTSDASVQGSVVLAAGGATLLSGSTVEAGSSPVLVKLRRGGTVRVCPGSTLSMSTAQTTSQGLMLSLNTGALETAYELGAAADSLVTPDFRILLSGPGAFHVAVGSDAKGNACVRSLPGNTAALVVTELMGSGSYQVKPQESVMFRNGHVAAPSTEVGACGCPAPAAPATGIAQAQNPAGLIENATSPPPRAPTPSVEPKPAPVVPPVESQPAPTTKPGEVQVQVDAPFVFSAVGPPPSVATVASLQLEPVPDLAQPEVVAPETPVTLQPPAKNKPAKKGFFGKVRSFFASIFK